MEHELPTLNVRELGGEIWAELQYAYRGNIHWKTLNDAIDLIMAVLARHIGSIITDDEGLPVTPLPSRVK